MEKFDRWVLGDELLEDGLVEIIFSIREGYCKILNSSKSEGYNVTKQDDCRRHLSKPYITPLSEYLSSLTLRGYKAAVTRRRLIIYIRFRVELKNSLGLGKISVGLC